VIQLPEKVDHSIRARRLLRRGDSLLVAVSGGVDSMVLLFLLHQLSAKYSWKLRVAHLNHGLRGRSSDADERLVVRAAKSLGLPVVTGRADIKQLALKKGISIEMAAREARHVFLARIAQKAKVKTIALAHHADDQVELFFLRVLRGSGGEGLSGMKWRGRSPANPRIQLIRPLLELTKADLAAFARAQKIPFREDGSNQSGNILRNRIRHELLPLLKRSYQPAIGRTILRLMEIAGADAEAVGEIARDWLKGKSRTPFGELPTAIQRRCIWDQLLAEQMEPDFALVERLRHTPNTAVSVSSGKSVSLEASGKLRVAEPVSMKSDSLKISLGTTGEVVFGGRKFTWQSRFAKATARCPRAMAGREIFDADRVGPSIILRHWRPGDRFQPIGMKSPVKLQDLFTNQKIARPDRHRLVVATTVRGELFWVENLRISEQFKVSQKTTRRLQWRWKPVY
jgi:tRNA(Ile)-lysidine synthase